MDLSTNVKISLRNKVMESRNFSLICDVQQDREKNGDDKDGRGVRVIENGHTKDGRSVREIENRMNYADCKYVLIGLQVL